MSRGRSRASTRRREPAPPQSLLASPHPLGKSLRPCVAEQWASAFWRRNPPGVIRRPPTRTSASDLRPINYVVVQCGDRQFCRPWESTQLSLSSHFTVVRAPQQYCVAPIEPRYFPYLPRQTKCKVWEPGPWHLLWWRREARIVELPIEPTPRPAAVGKTVGPAKHRAHRPVPDLPR